ncbi:MULTISPECIES: branched-chain amino acid ABC transporter permease [Chlorobium]|uniref:Inner-membrane translocator n=2 Tax=Chlorobium TaxID=1091 RepID=Q0YSX2_9CHLB|nr:MULTISPECIES: branched-chain amino acid ABC transporter permease [Chlorobium]EAT59492.1 inner-membrane translocator [Chlorobium ferrooxidans DSM 13031]
MLFLQALVSGILSGGVYALAGIGMSLVFGVMNISNFAHGDLMMLGMYLAYFAFTLLHIDPYLALLLIIPVSFLFGFILEKVFIHRVIDHPHQNQILLTIGLGLIMSNTALLAFTSDPKILTTTYSSSAINTASGLSISVPLLLSFVITSVITAVLYLFLAKSSTGMALRATSQNREAAQLMGINVAKMSAIAFGIGTALAATAGALIAPTYYIHPLAGHSFLLKSFTICVLGGLGSVVGAGVGGIIIGVVESMAATYISTDWKDVVVFVLFLTVLLFRPQGLFGKKGGQ